MRWDPNLHKIGTVFDWDIDDILNNHNSVDGGSPGRNWDTLLQEKRDDDSYETTKESIRLRGFVRPLTAMVYSDGITFGDGHHRLAAAIELGYTSVPVELFDRHCIARDYCSWYEEGGSIPTDNRVAANSYY